MLTRNRADIERTIANVRDATDWADKLVQKIFANPFVLSPFYKPTPETSGSRPSTTRPRSSPRGPRS